MPDVTVTADGLQEALSRWATDLAVRLADGFTGMVEQGASRRTGHLVDSIEQDPPIVFPDEVTVAIRVGADYAIYNDQGVGIYGPEGVPITPRRPGGVLVFDWPAAGGIVFARSVQGYPGTHFWSRAVERWPEVVARVEAGG